MPKRKWKKSDDILGNLDPLVQFEYCQVCGHLCPDATRLWARKQLQRMTCSPACNKTDIIKRFACCDLAEFMQCVCTYAFKCETHGERHIGTHD